MNRAAFLTSGPQVIRLARLVPEHIVAHVVGILSAYDRPQGHSVRLQLHDYGAGSSSEAAVKVEVRFCWCGKYLPKVFPLPLRLCSFTQALAADGNQNWLIVGCWVLGSASMRAARGVRKTWDDWWSARLVSGSANLVRVAASVSSLIAPPLPRGRGSTVW